MSGMNIKEDFFERKKRESGVSLNEIQLKAVLQTEGPLLLLASPGSGKTTTVIMRIGYLIEEKEVNPSRIKAITFSRASANDMKERFKRFFSNLPSVDFSTIHSFAFEVVKEHFRRTQTYYHIIEGDLDMVEQETFTSDNSPLHKKIILRKLFKSIVGENITDDQMDELTTYITFIKNKMIPTDKWSLVKTDVPEAERILLEYESFKRSGHRKLLVDFDDMLTIGNEALEGDRELLRKYQQRYDYMLTDESQDTSMVQHAIIEKMVRDHKNLCVVADDDQCIYSWRGADPSYLLDFKQVYPTAVTLFMEQNYRSSIDIVNVANQFIKRNKNRYEKNMFTKNPKHRPVLIKNFVDYKYQAKYLVEVVKKLNNLSEIAVLFRNNSASVSLMNAFERAGIPFFMKDVDNRFFKHWVVEDILNFMRMTFSDKRPDILEKIHLKIIGYITKLQIVSLKEINNNESVFDNLLNHVQLQDYQVKQIQECKETFRKMKGIPPLDAIRIIRTKLGYEKALVNICERFGFRKDYLIGIINILEEIADTLGSMEEFANRLKILESVMKTSETKKGQNAVTFSTLHSAKGLEFERVYMIDLIDGILPSSDDLQGGSNIDNVGLIEEAVRLFYVGMTRAKIHLELLSYRERDGEKVNESSFVLDVRNILNPPKQIEDKKKESIKHQNSKIPYNPKVIRIKAQLVLGKVVKHRVFGHGKIVKVNDERIHIQFEASVKQLSIVTCLEMGLLQLTEQ